MSSQTRRTTSSAGKLRRSFRWRGLGGTLRQTASDASALLDVGHLYFSHRQPGPANDKEFRVFAPRRSGHHAVMQWVWRNSRGRVVFLNDCLPDDNPFVTCRGPHVYTERLTHRFLALGRESAGCFSKKGTLIYNYENFDFDPDRLAYMDEQREAWVGPSRQREDILILRDPFNLFSSVLRARREGRRFAGRPALREARQLWKAAAREWVRDTRHLNDPLLISFNDWFASHDYRRTLAERLGLASADKGLERVAPWGQASRGASFDGLSLDGQASKMRVLDRWRAYESDDVFLEAVDDEELWTLSERIFGPLPGTEALAGHRP